MMICPICGVESHTFECKPCSDICRQKDKTVVEILYELLDVQSTKQVLSKQNKR